jgi:hypothetical protein
MWIGSKPRPFQVVSTIAHLRSGEEEAEYIVFFGLRMVNQSFFVFWLSVARDLDTLS